MRAFDPEPEDGAQDFVALRARRQRPIEIGAGVDTLDGGLAFPGPVERAFEEAHPGPRRPQLADGKGGDVTIGIRCVGVVILASGAFDDGGQDLEPHIAFEKTGEYRPALGRAFGNIAIPKQTVGVPIPHKKAVVERGGTGGDRVIPASDTALRALST